MDGGHTSDVHRAPVQCLSKLLEMVLRQHHGLGIGVVHLPVSCHKRFAGHEARSFQNDKGGRMRPPLDYLSASEPPRREGPRPAPAPCEAPPPVEMNVMRSARSNLLTAATLSPPPMMVSRLLRFRPRPRQRPSCRPRTPPSRTRPWGRSRTRWQPAATASSVQLGGLGTDVEAHHVGRGFRRRIRSWCSASSANRSAHTTSTGSSSFTPRSSALREHGRRALDPVFLFERGAHLPCPGPAGT